MNLDFLPCRESVIVSSFACAYEYAHKEFEHILKQTVVNRREANLALHLIQSFEPGESTPEQAHKIGKRLSDEVTKGKYEYVLTTHIDKGHIHNHIMFCAAIRRTSDELCREYGKLRAQANEYGIIKRNVDIILAHAVDRSKAKTREAALRDRHSLYQCSSAV